MPFSPTLSVSGSAYAMTIEAFSVINQYPQPVPYSAPRNGLTSGNARLDFSLRLPREWQVQLSNSYFAADLIPQGRTGCRFSLDAGVK